MPRALSKERAMTSPSFARIAVCFTLLFAIAVSATTSAQSGRYKKQGDECVWTDNDSGPNQCSPTTAGRFKKSGNNCVWDANDKGADQCKPTSGRFKKDGDRCVWTPDDSGPNQCNPRQAVSK
jgi:hypothetical protein